MRNRLLKSIAKECTFYRVHLLSFTCIPLVLSSIFYGSNGEFHVSYLDSLFLCYSAMTVTGLSTVNLSTTTAWQQVILYLLMIMGDFTVVSWIMVLVRKQYFRNRCEYVRSDSRTRAATLVSPTLPSSVLDGDEPSASGNSTDSPNIGQQLLQSQTGDANQAEKDTTPDTIKPEHAERFGGVDQALENELSTTPTIARRRPRIKTETLPRSSTLISNHSQTIASQYPHHLIGSKYEGHGGFPGITAFVKGLVQRMLPETFHLLDRKLKIPHRRTLFGKHSQVPRVLRAKWQNASWLKFDGLVVGRNSLFHTDRLTDEQLEEIGGVEYRALRLLSYLVAFYFVGTQVISFILFAPWLSSTHEYDKVFEAQPRLIRKSWFSLFQVMASYTGSGLSLVDLGMVPFQQAYLMIFALMFAILAGNQALPVFLRLIIWIGHKSFRADARIHETLSFLLDHPRRCFVYMFPMHQTWFLVACLFIFSILEWVSFLILDIGLSITDTLPVGTRVVAGLFQGLAARASGFAIVPVASLAPAVQFLYMSMMYIAVYPVAMSIRATNVYEEQSLGVFEAPPRDEDEGPQLSGTTYERIGKYLKRYLRRQLSIDIWWLVCAVFIVCIIERHNLLDDTKKWFDVFRVLFELVSAFGGIGLSLGLPSDDFSFSGGLKPLSKLVIIVVMVRGRHRGLPVAVDRSILLPQDLIMQGKAQNKDNENSQTCTEC
ncbi:cation transport protein-domain-containing protein [Gautieria morchelliformis]|nr:cation transport protein-domain-containing protein [Gautieria morchelliformis]